MYGEYIDKTNEYRNTDLKELKTIYVGKGEIELWQQILYIQEQ